MHVLFVILFILSLVLLVISIVKPGKRKDGTPYKREQLGSGFGIIAVILLIPVLITTTAHKQTLRVTDASTQSQSEQPTNTQSDDEVDATAPDNTAPKPSKPTPKPKPTVDTAKAKLYMTNATDDCAALFQQAQQALGNTQYPDSYTAMAALEDSSSAASRWSSFNQKLSSTDYTSGTTDAYNNAGNLYTDAGVDTPSAIDDWYGDINDAYSDIGEWAVDATSWQISTISTSKLNSDAQQFQQDLAAAKAVIGKL